MGLLNHTVGEYLIVFLFFHKHFTYNNVLISQNTIYKVGTIITILQMRNKSHVKDTQIISDKAKFEPSNFVLKFILLAHDGYSSEK